MWMDRNFDSSKLFLALSGRDTLPILCHYFSGTTTPRPIRCYSADVTVIGDSEVTNSREEVECSPDSVCALVRLTAWIGGAQCELSCY